jgi:AcrR family transcriptional regulator
VRYRTTTRDLSRIPQDRRIQRTHALLHEALGELIREKSYERITVADILKRAKISRSTFYLHFRDKDDLLESSMRAVIVAALPAHDPDSRDFTERLTAFSLPLLCHVQQHRSSARTRLGERGRAVLHGHLRQVLAQWIAEALERDSPGRRRSRASPDCALLAQHIASTFVLVLHWWLDHADAGTPAQANEQFLALVRPVLQGS